jgi:hypothetical protein
MALGAGLGPSHGLVGQVLEVHFRRADGFGVSFDAGAGLYASGGLSLWSPGQRIRLGLGAHALVGWSELGPGGTRCGEAAAGPDQFSTGSALFVMGQIEHDFGARNGWGARYGGGLGVAGGCDAGVVPIPSFSLFWRY